MPERTYPEAGAAPILAADDAARVVSDRLLARASAWREAPVARRDVLGPSIPGVAAAQSLDIAIPDDPPPASEAEPSPSPVTPAAPLEHASPSVPSSRMAAPGPDAIGPTRPVHPLEAPPEVDSPAPAPTLQVDPPPVAVPTARGPATIGAEIRSTEPARAVEPGLPPEPLPALGIAPSTAPVLGGLPVVAAGTVDLGGSDRGGDSPPAARPGVVGRIPATLADLGRSAPASRMAPAGDDRGGSRPGGGLTDDAGFAAAMAANAGDSGGPGGSTGSAATDLTRTNELLQEIVDAIRKQASVGGASMPGGDKSVYAERY